ncbi:protein-disulfide reductase DsbD domain-containing protein [Flavisolibacter ginsengisoli]|jgi:thiol:disulfide interchange protein DsbD|uniref:Disulphide bond corrector protein DsbC n=1 Tax=Flavisolibacter ginsengisoli DSM 18119 TaxID=1121884 RepID=A0A1M5CV08_9BACT|nr:protein-disulfide reductase DsbD domain-containing protein [Flavisolibacter ginsengisoli]SHF58437.1 Disulphide bond corrector protein DsbC [Flavisolibacter ginsengisoli DSM 18119]
MKRLLLILSVFFTVAVASAQNINPVSWTFTSKKLGDKEYEIQMLATIQQGWHLYSQSQPADAIAQPTSFQFNKNPLLDMSGKVKEVGKMEKFKDKTLDVSANQYSNKVLFVQKVKIKGKAKTNVTGKLEFQTCNDEKCLPPKSVNFSIALK